MYTKHSYKQISDDDRLKRIDFEYFDPSEENKWKNFHKLNT